MEENERVGSDNMYFGKGPMSNMPNSFGYGFTYPGMMPFWGFGIEPNLWVDAGNKTNFENPVMRDYMNNMQNQMKPIDMLYPKCHKMMGECVYKECNMFVKNNNSIMPNRISREEFCNMVDNCCTKIMNNEDMFIDKLKEQWLCNRDIDVEDDEIETRGNLGRYGNLLIRSMMGVLLVQELRRRGCLYCY